ncbi:hypothetical protein W59_21598 [Rhodococcus opacus RKJ300 = JCM 13270]|uniref:Uncharacterized protein n=1 Tax=Rhodococcus opacus RKJ300 = JCM 13270 TaxID=1165867 RepID=I0WN64_RHOOP|nr:hypothetical protein W59_21598 [Rhodococcus opacus RKJ300 = JCM 13270]
MVVGTTGATGCTAAGEVLTGAATVVVVGTGRDVVGLALDASTTRATDAVVVGVVLDWVLLLPHPVTSTAPAIRVIAKVVFFTQGM